MFNSFILLIVHSRAYICLFAVEFPKKNIQELRVVANFSVLLMICCLTTRLEGCETCSRALMFSWNQLMF